MRTIKFRYWHPRLKIMGPNKTLQEFLEFEALFPDRWDNDIIFMQFTGLKDKNGKEIYEGDILKMDNWEPENVQVRFIEGAFCLAFLNGEYKDLFAADIHYVQHADKPRSEIIGNIYENPELLTN